MRPRVLSSLLNRDYRPKNRRSEGLSPENLDPRRSAFWSVLAAGSEAKRLVQRTKVGSTQKQSFFKICMVNTHVNDEIAGSITLNTEISALQNMDGNQ